MSKFYELSETEIEKAKTWLTSKGVDIKLCPVCGSSARTIFPRLLEISTLGKGFLYPSFATLCINCGHHQFFNALLAKVVSPEDVKNVERWKED